MSRKMIYWEIQYFNPYTELWDVLAIYDSEEEAMKKAPFYAHQRGEVRIVKHEETLTILGTMKMKEKYAKHP